MQEEIPKLKKILEYYTTRMYNYTNVEGCKEYFTNFPIWYMIKIVPFWRKG